MKESLSLERVRPAKPIAPYIGGKRNLSGRLVEMISATPHSLYAEPCVGMGGVFLRRTHRPKAEVINDISEDVVTLFRILEEHYEAFFDHIKWKLSSRAEFERLMATDPATLTDIRRAARFLYLQKHAFGGKVHGRNLGVSYDGPARWNLSTLGDLLQDVRDRLQGVLIERLPFEAFIRRYDRPGALFFIDPPYWGNEEDYGPGVFSEADFAVLRDLLAALKGRFILTINDRPETRSMFAGFAIEPVRLSYRVSGAVTEGRELIITGGR